MDFCLLFIFRYIVFEFNLNFDDNRFLVKINGS